MRLISLALSLFAINLVVGCGDSGNTNVMQNADAEAIVAYEESVRKSEEAAKAKAMTPQEMERQMQEIAQAGMKNAESGK